MSCELRPTVLRPSTVIDRCWGRELVFLGLAGTAWGAFPQDPQNDPGFDPAEEGGPETCLSTSVNDEQHYLFSNMPQCTPKATDPEGAPGMFIAPNARSNPGQKSVWRNFTTGTPDTVIAYVEGGINWHNGDEEELRNRVFLNAGELPDPTDPDEQAGAEHRTDRAARRGAPEVQEAEEGDEEGDEARPPEVPRANRLPR